MDEHVKPHQKKAAKLNKFMHGRNPYKTPPSFKQLATLYPDFRKYCKYDIDGKVRLNFSDPAALAQLAITLLHKDFGLLVTAPPNSLVPTIPLRLNYLLWLQDIVGLWVPKVKQEEFCVEKALESQRQEKLMALKGNSTDNIKTPVKEQKVNQFTQPVLGLDVGCGAMCVYGLLGAKHCGFSMLSTETDSENISAARENVERNKMETAVKVLEGSADSFFGVLKQEEALSFIGNCRASGEDEPMETDDSSACDSGGYFLDFTMCNPPFFSCESEVDSCAKSKKDREGPNNGFTGKLCEVVVDGGEVSFISKMVEESVLYKDKIRVFSTLVGTQSDLKAVKSKVASVNPLHLTSTEFCQGRTMRWGIAWSWCPSIHLEVVVSKKQILSTKPLEFVWPKPSGLMTYTVQAAWEAVNEWLVQIKLKPKVFKDTKYFIGASVKAYNVTWHNLRKKRREENKLKGDVATVSPDTSTSSLSNLSDETEMVSTKRLAEEETDQNVLRKKARIEEEVEEEEVKEEKKATGKPCLLKLNLHMKVVDGRIALEMNLLSGVMGRDGANQLMQYIKNREKELGRK